MTDLTTTYLGLELRNPLVASASPLSQDVETVRKLEEAGIAAVVMYSLFEEQIIHESLELDHYLDYSVEASPEFGSIYPQTGSYALKPDRYVEKLGQLKKAVKVPIIGSLNGISTGGWIKYAEKIEAAGADALELNLYYLPVDPAISASQLEDDYAALVKDICDSVRIPVAVKLSPFFTALPNTAKRMVEAGAKGLVLFNRFYQPDLDIEALEVIPHLTLSTSQDLRLPLRWIAILYGRVACDFALTSGVHTAEDVLKSLMAGSSAVMLASELLQRGPGRVAEILADLGSWMADHEYESVVQMKGSLSQKSAEAPAAFERANYMRTLGSYRPLP
jgi:dihydroorotate dehydrogenase (fumarate)